jgi:hypothetical protein
MLQDNARQNLKLLINYLFRKLTIFREKPQETLCISFNNELFESKSFKGFQSRNQSILSMILNVFETPKTEEIKRITIYTGDYPKSFNNDSFYFCVDKKSKLSRCIPDFTFYHWREAGIVSYIKVRQELLQNSYQPHKYNKLFWAGNIETHDTRKLFLAKFKKLNELFEIHDIKPDVKNMKRYTLLEHLEYKYLIDIQGNGYSGRLKFLLHSGRLLFIQDRKWKTYYHYELIPFVHFIPVAEDFSDLLMKIEWAENNETESLKIVKNARQFAIVNLDFDTVLENLRNKLFVN